MSWCVLSRARMTAFAPRFVPFPFSFSGAPFSDVSGHRQHLKHGMEATARPHVLTTTHLSFFYAGSSTGRTKRTSAAATSNCGGSSPTRCGAFSPPTSSCISTAVLSSLPTPSRTFQRPLSESPWFSRPAPPVRPCRNGYHIAINHWAGSGFFLPRAPKPRPHQTRTHSPSSPTFCHLHPSTDECSAFLCSRPRPGSSRGPQSRFPAAS